MKISRRSLFKKLALIPAAMVAGKVNVEAKPAKQPAKLPNLSGLHSRTISTAHYHNISTGEALGVLLDAAGWPADKRIIAVGTVTMRHWFLNNENAFTAMMHIQQAEGPDSSIYEDAYGNFVFETERQALISESQIKDVVIEALQDGVRTGRLSNITLR